MPWDALTFYFVMFWERGNVSMVKPVSKSKLSNGEKEYGKSVFLFPRTRLFVPRLEIFYAYVDSKINIYDICIHTHILILPFGLTQVGVYHKKYPILIYYLILKCSGFGLNTRSRSRPTLLRCN
ncbi:hypothetical protein HJG60_008942 [Phyllostomus discolor]|uniref:Uncharacterized protein n=1 Tax=Phyllostomus discolor TaxID=89673 RepID=A0A834DIA8_9CHIR|nr:hypothetical protein HJG60_008942 [Phyllostomus discolor]